MLRVWAAWVSAAGAHPVLQAYERTLLGQLGSRPGTEPLDKEEMFSGPQSLRKAGTTNNLSFYLSKTLQREPGTRLVRHGEYLSPANRDTMRR